MPLLGNVLTVDGAVPPDTWPTSAITLKIGKLNERSPNMLLRVIFWATLIVDDVWPEIVAEIGHAAGGTVETYNSFSGGRADQASTYGSLGLRVGW